MHDKGIGWVAGPTAETEAEPQQQLTDDRLTWTVPEAARVLGISKDLAYEAAHRGELPICIIGRRMMVPRAALLRLLDEAHPLGQPQHQ
jgi:excisionase family DNA binding protein